MKRKDGQPYQCSPAQLANLRPELGQKVGPPALMAYNKKRQGIKKEQLSYQEKLLEVKNAQLDGIQMRIEDGSLVEPHEMLINMMQDVELALQNTKLTELERQRYQDIQIKLYDRYTDAAGTTQAKTSNIDITVRREEDDSPDLIEQQLKDITNKLREE